MLSEEGPEEERRAELLAYRPWTVSEAEHLVCPASFTTWQLYFPLCTASHTGILRTATLFSNVLSIFGSSKIQVSSFCHCTERVGDPSTTHWNAAIWPRTVSVFSIFLVKVGGSDVKPAKESVNQDQT